MASRMDAEPDFFRDRVAELTAALHQYFLPYPSFDRVRFSTTAWMMVSESPLRPLPIQEVLARLTLWIFTVDAIIDERRLSPALLDECLTVCGHIVNREAEVPTAGQDLPSVLSDVVTGLEASPVYAHLGPMWQDSYRRMIRGMTFEVSASPRDVTLAQYLAHGSYSIGVPTYVLAAWILEAPTDANGGPLDPSEDLLTRLQAASGAIRLANDLRTWEKEQEEGTLNALSVLIQHDGYSLREAVQHVQRMMSLLYHQATVAPEGPAAQQLAVLVDRALRLYNQGDFHTVAVDRLIDAESSQDGSVRPRL